MRLPHRARVFWVFALVLAAFIGGCRRAIVIVPQPDRAYTERDTLYGYHRGDRVVISFRFDSVLRVDTVTRLDTLWRGGTRTIVRVDTLRVPTPVITPGTPTPGTPTPGTPTPPRIPGRPGTPTTPTPTRVDTVVVTRLDTVVVTRLDTVVVTRRDTVFVNRPDTIVVTRRDTVMIGRADTVRVVVRDTIRLTVRDTIRVSVRDTVFRSDTIRVAGRRTLFVPPGQYPPEGQCRVWVHDLPPGRQDAPSACNALGNIPAGAFVLFGGDAWDADYDWVAEAQRGAVPPEIVAVSRRRRP